MERTPKVQAIWVLLNRLLRDVAGGLRPVLLDDPTYGPIGLVLEDWRGLTVEFRGAISFKSSNGNIDVRVENMPTELADLVKAILIEVHERDAEALCKRVQES